MSDYDRELVKLRKVYPGGTVAVEEFDLSVKRGEFISFVGPSGCGKTTTLRMIAGLESITSGDLIIRGRNFTDVPTERRPTSTIFQNYAIFPHMTVRQNIEYGLHVRRLGAAEIKKRTDAIIEKLQLGDVVNAKEGALSGGQKQNHLNMHPYGCDGYLSTFVTFRPEIACRYWAAIQNNDTPAAAAVIRDFDLPLFKLIAAQPGGFDAGIHGVLELAGICQRWRRPPWYSLSDVEMERLGADLKTLGIF